MGATILPRGGTALSAPPRRGREVEEAGAGSRRGLRCCGLFHSQSGGVRVRQDPTIPARGGGGHREGSPVGWAP